MADEGAGTAAAEGGENGSGSQEVVNSIPNDWAESEHFKEFYGDDNKFDFDKFAEGYTSSKTEINELRDNQSAAPADGYSFEFPEGYPVDDAENTLQREMAKDAGLTQAQYEAIVEFDIARLAQKAESVTKGADEAKSKLAKEWGGHQKYETNMAAAAGIAEKIFGEEFVKHSDLGNNVDLLRGLYTLSQKLSEDTFREGSSAGSDGRRTGVDGEPVFHYGSSQ